LHTARRAVCSVSAAARSPRCAFCRLHGAERA
jgi:hypothetical protein